MEFTYNETSGDIDTEDGKTFARLYFSNRGTMTEAEFDAIGYALASEATRTLKIIRAI